MMLPIELIVYQIADFGMARDLDESNYYVSHGGKVPVKWTAPEVSYHIITWNTQIAYLLPYSNYALRISR